MKSGKLLCVLLLLAVISVPAVVSQSFGIGAEYGIPALGGLPQNAMLTFKVSEVPFVVGIGMQLGQSNFNLGLTLDWWLHHQHLVGIIDLYAGPGLYLMLPSSFILGGRIPVGLRIWPLGSSLLEVFLEIAPGLTFIDSSGVNIPNFTLQAAVGFRFWF
ncbi:MAG: hypothetical protein A2087_10520 [Spirochaetes bacterium GWD1_61_31]|nr:MAG: hypothetical protein A2Y37_11995 [Spirochaetes bacterium GWB1_60_80]OHD30103.1 MAG: hypothetical protein A2004_13855 [Spirochaetes bacterium GWC1_61_12]OHD34646.1 MAG: hypothetical protein A2087_10520 [Spirochaetes bacterium GWD1_61_31]OHD46462.1 MAG: hypothetical protein A2Y35_10425 [Spirochaetes bacterium GWE1_60_18]OHD59517.1 MAG: hypothetical protein A2Y32_10380 [Spirochaetes bacterium GWF1_60_12]HAW85786.1 hypothetical protein [Spirochaetaceae bacterium]